MAILRDLLINITSATIFGDATTLVEDICLDTRTVKAGSLFVALKGTRTDGHAYISVAQDAGASVIVCETLPNEMAPGLTYVKVDDTADAVGQIATVFYGFPSQKMKVVGVTGTNGKTTTATLLYQLFTKLGYSCGLISTVQNSIAGSIEPATHTTPDAISIQALLAKMVDAGCSYVFMEVSSHAIHQKRIAGIRFAGGIFTNITHDHLDYHHTFEEYIRVKKLFFDELPKSAFALSNIDDKRGLVMLQNTQAEKCTYSLKVPAGIKAKVLENNLSGLILDIDHQEAHFRMIGTFNAYNILAVYGAAKLLGQDKMQVLAVLSDLHGAPGRFETYLSANDKILGIVDYAHTPDALLNVLATIEQLRKDNQQIICIVGCGGDRDATKRPIMAQVACEHSDRAILTADNPRSEDPEDILNAMEIGLTVAQKRKMLRISDRREAIKTACVIAKPGDIILLAGKGHETYQEIKGVKYPFDDKQILTEVFSTLQK
jgi:UDP-N-acetylmuramoyl-L-alanyl-D-glutamate--2,6-diaminopimelate ligase